MAEAKQKYSSALRNLERISDEIHRHRSRRQSTKNGMISLVSIALNIVEYFLMIEWQNEKFLNSNLRIELKKLK